MRRDKLELFNSRTRDKTSGVSHSGKHLYQGWLARASRRIVVVRIVKLAPFLVVGVVPPVELPQRVPAAIEAAFGEAAEKEAEELGQDLVRDKHNERAQEDEPETQ